MSDSTTQFFRLFICVHTVLHATVLSYIHVLHATVLSYIHVPRTTVLSYIHVLRTTVLSYLPRGRGGYL